MIRLHWRLLSLKLERDKKAEQERPRWSNPLVIAIVGATIAAFGNAGANLITGILNYRLEKFKAGSARVLEVIKTTANPDEAAKNLTFLVGTGLITDSAIVQSLKDHLKNRIQGQGIALGAPACPVNPDVLKQFLGQDPAPAPISGSGHFYLSPESSDPDVKSRR